MRILVVHNYYQQLGGEDTIFSTEADLLESYGHEVYRYTIHNDQVESMGTITLAKSTIWNKGTYKKIRTFIQEKRPQIAHFHNTFPLISPAAYYAAKDEGIPVIQTLHNYRLLCPNGLFFRDGKVCEDCIGKPLPLPGIIHGCYRGNRVASAAVASMVKFHDLKGTWTNAVDVFIAYSYFALQKFIEGGIPKDKLQFKTNFLHPAPTPGSGQGGYGLFVGRLSPEKGLQTILSAWKTLGHKIPLKIAGDGPLAPLVQAAVQETPDVEWLGRRSMAEIYTLMGEASFLIFSSEWYETFGRVAIEAFAKGTPVIGAKIGAITELVQPMQTGLHFEPGNSKDLVKQVEWFLDNPEKVRIMRQTTRSNFEENYTASKNHQRLMEIYHLASAPCY